MLAFLLFSVFWAGAQEKDTSEIMMGIVKEKTIVSIQGTKLKTEGPLLITHWGMSGPAILKLSAFGARLLSEKDYNFIISYFEKLLIFLNEIFNVMKRNITLHNKFNNHLDKVEILSLKMKEKEASLRKNVYKILELNADGHRRAIFTDDSMEFVQP